MAAAERMVTPQESDEFLAPREDSDRDFEHSAGRIDGGALLPGLTLADSGLF